MTNPNGSPRPTLDQDSDSDEPANVIRPDEEDDSFEEVDMIEILDDDLDNDGETDFGDLADIEDEDEEDMDGEGLEGFTGIKPDYILGAHMDSAVFCVSFDRTGTKIITGGEDDVGNMWDSEGIKSRFPSFKCKGHTDSVVCASFNHDSTYFSTCDLSGTVKVWKDKGPVSENVATFETGDLSWSFWHYGSNVLFAGADDGSIYMWKIPTGECKIFSGSSSKSECVTLLPDGKKLVSGYADGGVKMFDLKTGATLFTFAKASGSGVLCIDHHKTHSIIATGSGDGTVRVYNTNNGKLITTWNCGPDASGPAAPLASPSDQEVAHASVESISFYSETNYLAAGTITGDVVIWDVGQMTERVRVRQEVGVTKVLWHPLMPLLFTGGLDGVIRVIDVRSCKEERQYGRHKREILDFDLSRDGSRLVSGSDDGTVYIYNLKE